MISLFISYASKRYNYAFLLVLLFLSSVVSAQETVTSLLAQDANPSNSSSVEYVITFSGSGVSGLTTANFIVNEAGGVSGSSVSTVTGSGTSWTITVNTGTGDGTLELELDNAAGLTPTVTNVPYTEDIYTIDKSAPVLTTVVSSPSSGTLIVGDVQTVTITENSAETGLTVSSATINGIDVSGAFTDSFDGTYEFDYTVMEGEADQTAGNIPLNITLMDAAGNTDNVTAFTDGNTTAVDANSPTALTTATISVTSGTLMVTDGVTITVGTSVTGLNIDGATVNDIDVSGTGSDVGDGTYTFTYTVQEGETDQTAGNIPLNIELSEASGNSTIISAFTDGNTTAIDANTPVLTTVVSSPSSGTLIVGDVQTVTITENSSETGLTVSSATINGIDVSGAFTDNFDGTYEFDYTVMEGETDQTAGNIPLSITLMDAAGNTDNVTAFTDGNTTAVDANSPTISSYSLSSGNAYVDVTFSEGIYDDTGAAASDVSDWDINFTQNGGTATNVTLNDITNNSDAALSGGESVIRFVLGVSGAPDGNEFISIIPNSGSDVADGGPNLMNVAQTTGNITLNAVTPVTFSNVSVDQGNTYVDITFSEAVDRDAGSGTDELRLASNRELWYSYNDVGGSGATIGSASITETGGGALGTGGYSTIRFNFTVTGTPNGSETITFFPVDGSEIYSTATEVPMSSSETIVANLTEKVAPTFVESYFFDTDENGVIDEVVIEMNEAMDETTATNADFTLSTGTLSASAVNAATANNDLDVADSDVYVTFTISGYTEGTALGSTDLQYVESAGTFVDLAGNALAGSVDMSEVDLSAPIPSLNPIDEGINHGLDDPLVLTFSEVVNIVDLGGDEIYIVRTDVFPNTTIDIDITDGSIIAFASPTLTITPEDPLIGSATYSIVIEEGAIVDLASSPNNFGGFSTTDDWNFMTEVDATAPNLTITRQDTALGDKDSGTSDTSVSFDLYFDEPIDDGTFDEINITMNISDLEINGDATASQTSDNVTGSVSLVNMGDDQNYSFIINNIAHVNSAADGTLSISIDGVDDLAGNTIAAPEVSSDFVFDHFAPAVTTLTMDALGTTFTDYATDGDEVTIGVVFDDDVNDTPSMSLKSGNAAINNAITWDDQSDANATTWTATYDVSSSDTDGTLQYTLDFTDDAGNPAVTLIRSVGQTAGADDATTLTIDKTDPEITNIVRLTPTEERTNDSPVTFRVTFNEEVENVSADGSDFVVSGAATTGGITVATQTANTVFDVSIAGVSGDGLLDLDMDGGNDITDLADNTLGAINSEETYTIDNTSPTFNSSTASAIDNVVDITVNLNESGSVHYLVVKRDVDGVQSNVPTVADVTNQDGAYSTGAGGTFGADGEITVSLASTNYNVEETLDANSVYDVYLVSEDESLGNVSGTVTSVTAIQTGGVLITAPTEAGICLEGDAVVLGDIVLDEVLSTDFSGSTSNVTLRLGLPTGFEFNTAVGSVAHATGDINASSLDYVSNEVVRITFSMEDLADDEIDQLTISDLEIYGTGSTEYTGVTIDRVGGTSSLYQAEESDDPGFATLSSVAPYDQMTITSTDPGVPYLEEITTDVANGNVVNDEVSLFVDEDITGNYGTVTPITIYAELASDIVRIYSDEGLTMQVGGNYTGSTSYTPSLTDFGLSAANLGINKFWISIENASGCESTGALYAITLISDVRSDDATTLSEANTVGVDLQLSLPDSHDGLFSGVGLSSISYDDSDNNLAEATFIPNNVGVGSYGIDYTLSESVDDISVTYTIAFTVISSELVFNVSDVSFCEDESNIEVNDDDAGDYDIEVPSVAGFVFYDVKIYEYKDDVEGVVDVSGTLLTKPALVSTGGSATDLSSGWIFDPSATHQDDQDTLIFSLEMRDTSNDAITEVATQQVIIYSIPEVTLDNDEDDTDTFDEYYCATDDAFDLYVTISSDLGESTEVISQGYTLIQDVDEDGFGGADDVTTVFGGAIVSFDPADPHGDASNETGLFRISYTTEGITDAGCTNSSSVDFEVFPQPSRPTFASDLSGIGGLDAGSDYYLLEYGAGATVADLVSNVNDSISWYTNAEKSVGIEIADLSGGETITAEELYGTSSPSGGINKVFYFTDWTNLGIDPDEEFVGCESEVREVNVLVHSSPNAPNIDVSGSFNGTVTRIGTNRYIYEYCEGETLDDVVLTNDISDLRSYFVLLNEAKDDSTRISTNTVSAADFGYTGAVDTDTTIYVVHIQNDSTYTSGTNPEIVGVFSDTTEVSFVLHSIPDQPVIEDFADIGDDDTYKFCSGATLDEIETPNLTGYVYEWANDDGGGDPDTGSIITTSTSDNSRATRAELGYSSIFTTSGSKEVNTYHVRNYIGTNDESGFVGCPSDDWTAVEVTVYPQPVAPFNSAAFSSNGTTGPDTYEYCQEQDISAENLDLDNIAGSADGVTEYKWYSSNPDGLSLTPFYESTITTVSFTTIQNRTDVDIDTDASTRIYVTQITDELCESNSLPVDVIINRIPDVDIVDYGTSSFTDAYCNDNGLVTLQGQVDGADYTGSDDSWSIDTGGLTEVSNLGEFDPNAAATAAGEATTQGSATDHDITYSYTITATSCSNAVTKTITVNPLPVVKFNSSNSDLDNTDYGNTLRICEDEEAIELTGDVDGNGSGSFYVDNSELSTNTNLEATFSVADFGETILTGNVSRSFDLSFEYADDNNCVFEVEKTIEIDDVPEVSFDILGGCESPAVVFESNLVNSDSPYSLEDLSYTWAFFDPSGGSEGTDTGQDVSKTFVVPDGQEEEVFEAFVIATTTSAVTTIDGGCSTADNALTRQDVPILISPTVAFVWDTVSVNQQTSFYVNEVLLGSDKIDSIALVFYNGADTLWYDVPQASEIAAGETSEAEILADDDFDPFYYTYTSAGIYEVSIQMITENDCNTTLIRNVNIIPSIEVTAENPYFQGFSSGSFDMNTDGWYSETLLEDEVVLVSVDPDAALRESSWNWVEIDLGDDTEKATDADDWVWSTTAVNGSHYYQDENSWLYSPTFDLSTLEKPMMKFSAIFDFEDAKDGVVVQYSVDRGQKWKTLGGYIEGESTGIEWYNSDNVGSDPGEQQSTSNDDADQSVGWSGSENSEAWTSARHSLDEIGYDDDGNFDETRLNYVRFRFAMASTSDTDKSENFGFAFDDFEILERSKGVVIEQFVSVSEDDLEGGINTPTATLKNSIEEILNTSSTAEDAILVAYHTDLGFEDPINIVNPAGPSARSIYYNIDDVTSVLDGNTGGSNSSGKSGDLTWDNRDLGLNSLKDPGFEIIVTADPSATETNIKGTIEFIATDNFAAESEFRAYLIVLENSVAQSIVVDGEELFSELDHVVRKVLPDGSGEYVELDSELIPGSSLPLGTDNLMYFEWELSNILDDSELSAVVIIQNNITKEIYQALSLDVSDDLLNGKNTSSITNVDDDIAQMRDFNLFPNPSDSELFVKFNQAFSGAIDWVIFDQSGRIYRKGLAASDEPGFSVETNDFPNGLYFMSIRNEGMSFEMKKILIAH